MYTIKYAEWAGAVITNKTKTFGNYADFIVWLRHQITFRPQYFICVLDG